MLGGVYFVAAQRAVRPSDRAGGRVGRSDLWTGRVGSMGRDLQGCGGRAPNPAEKDGQHTARRDGAPPTRGSHERGTTPNNGFRQTPLGSCMVTREERMQRHAAFTLQVRGGSARPSGRWAAAAGPVLPLHALRETSQCSAPPATKTLQQRRLSGRSDQGAPQGVPAPCSAMRALRAHAPRCSAMQRVNGRMRAGNRTAERRSRRQTNSRCMRGHTRASGRGSAGDGQARAMLQGRGPIMSTRAGLRRGRVFMSN